MSEAAEGDWMGVGGQESVRLLFYALLSRTNFIFDSTCDFCASLPQAYLGAFGHGGGRLPGHVHCKANGCLCLQVRWLSPFWPLPVFWPLPTTTNYITIYSELETKKITRAKGCSGIATTRPSVKTESLRLVAIDIRYISSRVSSSYVTSFTQQRHAR